jgi:hypothetical protein
MIFTRFIRIFSSAPTAAGMSDNGAISDQGNDAHGSMLNPNKQIRVKRGTVRFGLITSRVLMAQYRREISDGEDQCSCPKHSLEEPTPAYILDWAHAIFSAASLIALRMRW